MGSVFFVFTRLIYVASPIPYDVFEYFGMLLMNGTIISLLDNLI